MDEPSAAPLARKLGIQPGHRVAFVNAPEGFLGLLASLPLGVSVDPAGAPRSGRAARRGRALLFVARRDGVGVHPLARRLAPAGGLWVTWPKKASGVESDLSEDVVQSFGLGGGLVDNKVCSVDATWSALRFVRRLKDRQGAGRRKH